MLGKEKQFLPPRFGLREGIAEPSEYSGEIDETRNLIFKWQREVDGNANKLEVYTPQIIDLAIAYFSKQMSEMYPDRKEQYERERFKDAFAILSPREYRASASSCNPRGKDPAALDPLKDKIEFSPRILYEGAGNKRAVVETAFLVSIHELLHLASPLVRDGRGFFTQGISEPVQFKRGLKAYTKDIPRGSRLDQECYASWWHEAEETVVEHAATKLCERVGVNNLETGYRQWINDYQKEVIAPQFQGSFEELLSYQQTTDSDGFFAAVGRKFARSRSGLQQEALETMPFELQVGIGIDMIRPLFDESKIR